MQLYSVKVYGTILVKFVEHLSILSPLLEYTKRYMPTTTLWLNTHNIQLCMKLMKGAILCFEYFDAVYRATRGSRRECKNHRGITLLSTPGKVFALTLLARIKTKLLEVWRPEQSGFTLHRSTDSHRISGSTRHVLRYKETDTHHNTSAVSWVAVYKRCHRRRSGSSNGEKPTCNPIPNYVNSLFSPSHHQYWTGTESTVSLCWKVLDRTDLFFAGLCVLYKYNWMSHYLCWHGHCFHLLCCKH